MAETIGERGKAARSCSRLCGHQVLGGEGRTWWWSAGSRR